MGARAQGMKGLNLPKMGRGRVSLRLCPRKALCGFERRPTEEIFICFMRLAHMKETHAHSWSLRINILCGEVRERYRSAFMVIR